MNTPRTRFVLIFLLVLSLPAVIVYVSNRLAPLPPKPAATPGLLPAATSSATAAAPALPGAPSSSALAAHISTAATTPITAPGTTSSADSPASTQPIASAPPELPPVPAATETLQVAVKFFALDLTGADARFASLATTEPGKPSILSPEEGWEAFQINRTGLDILSAPTVQMRSGEHAKVEIIRELIYPTAMENDPGTGQIVPTEFDTIDTGVMLDLEVRPTSDPSVLDVNLNPMIRIFENFVPSENNPDLQVPVFQETGTPYRGLLRNGSYLILGTRTDIEVVVNSIPFLGDLPLIGTFFRTEETIEREELIAIQPIVFPK